MSTTDRTVRPDLPFAERAWALSPSVALRPEPFGALAYDFVTRQLSFLKTPLLVDAVRRLADAPDAATAVREVGVDGPARTAYLTALEGLARTGIIVERAA
ncbi:mycofactocin biosynthesis chaperone MftB [Nocardioides rotundus]|uniref:mycofactocin biosynthesis chaperone MftB n=1 Tax=Nocardioides rotundus TaxID=1774216 RepID=UPI001CBE0226|nr:mycofactocin biosynthesis chaperone MftB [Nocardioides rotundus]UAL30825.1 mycofactocin biosynthesis chaperone MftB [Nocardioides rotundus]